MDIGLSVIRQGIPVASVVAAKRVGGSLGVPAGDELTVVGGDTVRVEATIEHRGPATSVRLYAAIGNRGVTFDEIWAATAPAQDLPQSVDWVSHTLSVDVEVIGGPSGVFDLYVKILETGAPGMPELANVIRVVGAAEENFVEVQDTIYPWAYTYEGNAETAVFEFQLTPEQIPGTEWLSDRIVDAFVAELEAQGSRLLRLKVSRDTTPTWWTNYRVEITATVEAGTAGTVGAVGFAWSAVIIGVLAILFIIAIVWAIRSVDAIFFKRSPLADETKALFDRNTLEMMVLDLAPDTDRATMAAMSDEELRHHLNAVLAELQPSGLGWAGLAVAGVLGAGVVVAALAFAGRPRE